MEDTTQPQKAVVEKKRYKCDCTCCASRRAYNASHKEVMRKSNMAYKARKGAEKRQAAVEKINQGQKVPTQMITELKKRGMIPMEYGLKPASVNTACSNPVNLSRVVK